MVLIETKRLTKFFGGMAAVVDLDMKVSQGEILGLIGPNGAGKTTVFNLLGGLQVPNKGRIIFNGEDVTRLPSHQRARRGIARVFQENLLFSSFTVLENVRVGVHLQFPLGPREVFSKNPSASRRKDDVDRRALQIIDFVGLSDYSDEPAVNLPHGRQRLLGLAIALATQPHLLLLDEPVTGMNAEEVETMMGMIESLRTEQGITCIIIEHNLRAVMGLCDRIAVLNFGKKLAEGAPEEIAENQAVTEAYLGVDAGVA